MERKLFLGIGAHVRNVAANVVTFVPMVFNGEDPVNAPATREIAIDVTLTPSKLGSAKWATVALDDRGVDYDGKPLVENDPMATGMLSNTIDQMFTPAQEGCVYLAYVVFHANKKKILPGALPQAVWPPVGYAEYELATIAYSNAAENGARAGKRFVGVHATIVDQRGSLVKVHIRWAGHPNWRGPFWIDLDDLNDCDSKPTNSNDPNDPVNTYPLVAPGSPGALFLRMERSSALHAGGRSMRGPKLPIGQD